MVGCKRESVTVGSGRIRQTAERKRIIRENDHDAIVSGEEYEKAHLVIQSRKKADYIVSHKYPLKGKVRSGNCHRMMTYAANTYEEFFFCPHGREHGELSKCYKERYPVKMLEGVILRSLMALLDEIVGLKGKDKAGKRKTTAAAIEGRIAFLKKSRLNLYELYAEGMSTKEEYLSRKAKLQEEISSLEAELKEARKAEEEESNRKAAVDMVSADADQFLESWELTDVMVERFIDTVYVYDSKTIEIEYTLKDVVRRELGI